jgi:hypothetical protein
MVRRKLIARTGRAANQYGVPSKIVWNVATALFTGSHTATIIAWTSQKSLN